MEIYELFEQSFYRCRKQKMVIYGIGENTKAIVENIKGYHIVGLLDGIKKSGAVYGLPLLDEKSLSKEITDMIVIVARSSNIGIILKRIARTCIDEGIEVYDIQGINLLKRDEEENKRFAAVPDRNTLLERIKEADVVSFDIFDTLIMRKLLFPSDVFELMEKYNSKLPKGFYENRIKCERELMHQNSSPMLDVIYNELQTIYGWTDAQRECYRELEFLVDRKCMILRNDMYAVYQECCRLQKKVYFISDMYYSKAQIVDILNRFQIREYEDILVSCEKGTSKTEGLFDYYLKIAPEGKKLHIGDDEDADIQPAQRRGMEVFHIFSARKMLEHSRYAELEFYAESLLEKVIIGCFIGRMFNSPFDMRDGKGFLKNKRDYGYLFIGTLVLKFCLWMIGKCREENGGNILFAARDGYIVKKVYEYLKDNYSEGASLPEAVYLYASRVAYVCMSMFDIEDIKFAYELAYDGSPEDMLRERFMLSEEVIEKYDAAQYPDKWDYIVKHTDKIIAKASQCRTNFYRYISAQKVMFDEKTAYFDFVSSGTCQRCLQKVTGQSLKGFYFSFIRSKYTENTLEIEELFHNQFGLISDSFLCRYYLFLEYIFSSSEPTLKGFDDEGNVLFLEEVRTEEQLKEMAEIQEGILELVRDVMMTVNNQIDDTLKKEIADKMFSYILKENTEYLVEIKGDGVLIDEFCHRRMDADAIIGNREL